MIKLIKVIASAVALLTLLPQSSSAALDASGFCRGSQVKDYLQPLKRLPDVRRFSPSGRLGVGPSALRVYPAAEHLVPIAHGVFEVRSAMKGSRSENRVLEWHVVSRLERINSRGQLAALMGKHEYRLRTVEEFLDSRYSFRAKGPPGRYRLVFEIRNRHGKRIELRQEYFRVLPAESKLRLEISDPSLHPGEHAWLRFKNLGTVSAHYGYGYGLIDSMGEEVRDEEGIFPNVLLKLRPGYAGSCFRFRVPVALPHGRYWVTAEAGDRLRARVPLRVEVAVN